MTKSFNLSTPLVKWISKEDLKKKSLTFKIFFGLSMASIVVGAAIAGLGNLALGVAIGFALTLIFGIISYSNYEDYKKEVQLAETNMVALRELSDFVEKTYPLRLSLPDYIKLLDGKSVPVNYQDERVTIKLSYLNDHSDCRIVIDSTFKEIARTELEIPEVSETI